MNTGGASAPRLGNTEVGSRCAIGDDVAGRDLRELPGRKSAGTSRKWGRHRREHRMDGFEGERVRGKRGLSVSAATMSVARSALRTKSVRTRVGNNLVCASWDGPSFVGGAVIGWGQLGFVACVLGVRARRTLTAVACHCVHEVRWWQ